MRDVLMALIGWIAVIGVALFITLRVLGAVQGLNILKSLGLNSIQREAYIKIEPIYRGALGRRLSKDEHIALAKVVRSLPRPDTEAIAAGLINDPGYITQLIESQSQIAQSGIFDDGWWDE